MVRHPCVGPCTNSLPCSLGLVGTALESQGLKNSEAHYMGALPFSSVTSFVHKASNMCNAVPEASVSFSLNFDTVGFWKILEIFFF